jgi:hypothetical protein
MKKSKYLGMRSGDWECTHVGVDRVQPVYTHFKDDAGKRVRSKSAGHQLYYYIFERITSDKKAMKMIRLNAAKAAQVYQGRATVEEFAKKKEAKRSQEFIDKVSYSFLD